MSESLGAFITEEISPVTSVEFDHDEEYKKSQPRPETTFPFLSSQSFIFILIKPVIIFFKFLNVWNRDWPQFQPEYDQLLDEAEDN